ncbi:MAG: DUF2285 domain-containing protein [Hyphomonadaceae bacterium]|nr:DUF2285 domain-containing protein [Hyphomonadaceae bacterium]
MPQDDTSVVVLTTAPAVLVHPGDQPDRLERTSEKIDGQGAHAMVALRDGAQMQILAIGAEPIAAVVPLNREGFSRLDAVYRLLAAIHGRAVPPDTRITQQQRVRMRRMLRAFDGVRDGATQQDIAQTLFRTGRLDRDEWQASSARHAIKSMLRDARAMIAGGYRGLLGHRRRP